MRRRHFSQTAPNACLCFFADSDDMAKNSLNIRHAYIYGKYLKTTNDLNVSLHLNHHYQYACNRPVSRQITKHKETNVTFCVN